MTRKSAFASFGLVAVVTAAFALGGGAPPKGRGAFTKVNGTAWRNSLADAQAEAKRTGKPILLLSMFGQIDEEMPCANARTLRATLFKDPDFQKFVTNEAIPAWEMVRPVPHVTIDFGDGKKIVRTVRGNAVMYLVNSEGKVFDAFPGVYTKADFLPAARESIARMAKADAKTVADYHEGLARDIRFTEITLGKSVVESPTLNLIGARRFGGFVTSPPPSNADPAEVRFLTQAARLADMSLTPMPVSEVLARTTVANQSPDTIPIAVLKQDSKLNMTRTRSVVHFYFAAQKQLPTPAEARDAVLGTILKIPYKDPTMGLSDVLMPGTPS